MSSTLRTGLAIGAAITALLLFGSMFVVHQTQQALVFRFGKVARPPIVEPGLYFKWPFVDNVVLIDRRIVDLESPPQEIIASDQKRLVVDAFTRYRVTDPLRFYQSVSTMVGANLRLSSIVNSTVRSVLADSSLTSIVRTDRSPLMQKIREEVNRQSLGLGIQVVDVRLRRADLPEQNSQAVFQRMQTERQREAADIRAQGSEMSQSIRAKADRDVVVIRAEATRDGEQVRGSGDAERVRLLAEAFGRDPEFFTFYRSMQAYENAMKSGDTRLVLSPDSEFFRYFRDPSGNRKDQVRIKEDPAAEAAARP